MVEIEMAQVEMAEVEMAGHINAAAASRDLGTLDTLWISALGRRNRPVAPAGPVKTGELRLHPFAAPTGGTSFARIPGSTGPGGPPV